MTRRGGAFPSASVVIPTFNRIDALRRVVDAVERQALPGDNRPPEIIVVDDGSTDETRGWMEEQAARGRLRALTGANAGPATARNRGLSAASGDVLLFLGDDTVPQAGWLLAHLEQHRLFGGEARPLAVVGYTGFPPADDTPFARFVNEFGAQFGYQLIEDPCRVPFNFFYTSNVSITRAELADRGGFREDFPAAAWEDIELAYRATREGLVIHYLPRARTVHHHRIRPRTFCRRQRTAGRSAAIFARLHPELEDFLGVGRLRDVGAFVNVRHALLGLAVLLGEHVPGIVPSSVLLRYVELSYLQGLAEGLQTA